MQSNTRHGEMANIYLHIARTLFCERLDKFTRKHKLWHAFN